jgi:Na+-transporting methylmalonyl-CoA/oxaloacetate decarboxylase gamma subunit
MILLEADDGAWGFQNLPWGLEITGVGMGAVFAMLILLMLFLILITWFIPWLNTRKTKEVEGPTESVAAAASAAPVLAAKKADKVSDNEEIQLAAAIAVALHSTPGVANDLTPGELATIAVAIHQLEGHGAGDFQIPALVANQSGKGLERSRWVGLGRSKQITTWHRS